MVTGAVERTAAVVSKGLPNKGPSEQRPQGNGGRTSRVSASPKKENCVQQTLLHPRLNHSPPNPNFLSAQIVPPFSQMLRRGTALGSFPSLSSPHPVNQGGPVGSNS